MKMQKKPPEHTGGFVILERRAMDEQEEMRRALVEKFYELSDIHLDDIETTQDNVIAAANVMDTIYNTLYHQEAPQQ